MFEILLQFFKDLLSLNPVVVEPEPDPFAEIKLMYAERRRKALDQINAEEDYHLTLCVQMNEAFKKQNESNLRKFGLTNAQIDAEEGNLFCGTIDHKKLEALAAAYKKDCENSDRRYVPNYALFKPITDADYE